MVKLLISYLISTGLYLIYLYIGKKKSIRQTERELGPSSHKIKNGTITAGGMIFTSVFIILTVIFYGFSKQVLFIIVPTILIFIVGLLDDFKGITKKKNDGLSPSSRIIIEIIIAGIALMLLSVFNFKTDIKIFNNKIDIYIFYPMFFIFMVLGTVNSFNLTDGVDGLLSSITLVILLTLLFIASAQKNYEIIGIIFIILGSLFSFYFFNYHRSFMFMGDCGSLSLGIICYLISVALDVEIIFIILCIPVIFETISDIIQVSYFKISKGKRVFKMAPFHHHLELSGYSEEMIRTLFVFTEVLLSILVLYLGGYL